MEEKKKKKREGERIEPKQENASIDYHPRNHTPLFTGFLISGGRGAEPRARKSVLELTRAGINDGSVERRWKRSKKGARRGLKGGQEGSSGRE